MAGGGVSQQERAVLPWLPQRHLAGHWGNQNTAPDLREETQEGPSEALCKARFFCVRRGHCAPPLQPSPSQCPINGSRSITYQGSACLLRIP